jgi:hypothetical protein
VRHSSWLFLSASIFLIKVSSFLRFFPSPELATKSSAFWACVQISQWDGQFKSFNHTNPVNQVVLTCLSAASANKWPWLAKLTPNVWDHFWSRVWTYW